MNTYRYNYLIVIGFTALAVGLAVYYFDRSPTLLSTTVGWEATPPKHHLFGMLGYNLPTLLHTLSFALLTVGMGRLNNTGAMIAVSSWGVINLLFEAIQHPTLATQLYYLFPNSKLSHFALSGTFDPFDVLAITVGALLSALILKHFQHLSSIPTQLEQHS